jgi:hypothetical protein
MRSCSEQQNARLRKLERMSLWSCTFNNLYAAARRPDPSRVDRPLSFGETCVALQQIAREQDYNHHYALPELLRMCLAQMLSVGYQANRYRDVFNHLVAEVTSQPAEEAVRSLTEYGYAQYGKDSRQPRQPPPLDYLAEQSTAQAAFPEPTTISYDGRVYTVTKTMLLRCPATELAMFIDPANWRALGPFFEVTEPEDTEPRKPEYGKTGWRGVLHEVFKIDWNGWTAEHFDVRLKIDHTVSSDLVRADYSLVYEKHDQLRCDDGSVEIRKIPGRNDWCRYTGKKSLKFASDLLNLIAPGVLFMGLEREALSITALARLVGSNDGGGALQQIRERFGLSNRKHDLPKGQRPRRGAKKR